MVVFDLWIAQIIFKEEKKHQNIQNNTIYHNMIPKNNKRKPKKIAESDGFPQRTIFQSCIEYFWLYLGQKSLFLDNKQYGCVGIDCSYTMIESIAPYNIF